MNKILFLLLSVFVLSSCSDEIPEEKVPLKTGRTIMAYLISNNKSGSLDRNLKQNLVDMYSGLAQTTDSCTLLVYYRPYVDKDGNSLDTDGLQAPSLLQFNSDGKGNINGKKSLQGNDLTPAKVIGEAFCSKYTDKNHNATDHVTMLRVLGDMIKLSPSTNYGLIFGSHGTSWMKGNAVSGRSFGDDAGYNINIPEMADALEEAFSGKQLDFILFDACMMATAEVCYEFKDVTDYLIGAVVETHVYGHPYDVILPKMYRNAIPYNEICKDYIDYSRELGAWGTCSAIDCSKMDELAGWVGANLKVYSEKLLSLDIDDIQQYGVVNDYGEGQFKYFSFDIDDFFKTLNEGIAVEGLENIMNEVVISKEALYGKFYITYSSYIYIEEGHFCGLGMYFPYKVSNSSWNSYYETLSWYKAVGWKEYKESLANE